MTLNEITTALTKLKGVLGVAIVDASSGMMMAYSTSPGSSFDLEIASAGCVDIIRAKSKILKMVQIDDVIHDIQVNMYKQIHLICPCSEKENTFIYLVADRATANISICRRSVFAAEKLVDF
ncbi:hypothetical protein QDY71_07245 [Kingella negevensis]|uniref:Roadblock/LC7 domain protein n=1 Tax=Kingella negevensis TaxID=1522312 RepID=A0A238HGX6_9NEIS|nr:hypothetical protein [Kingella negevensis]MDK4681068.1 hypothetical protein [Kingella negevensis]MDK4683270.1 hypothetical protein [Kingella negevensis]MDK4683938.1 hypothetical protein [Kingella negevensis]MDK4691598.1 hypothetical protein [Kingella negevensis]MDK4693251.1 hypothetical protein [Kingella negevensis]